MKKIILYISCLFIINSYTDASVLLFVDNAENDILEKIQINKSLQNVDSLSAYFINLGYFDVSINQSSDTFHITIGTQYMLKSIYFDATKISNMIKPKKFTQQNVSSELDKILSKEKEEGYQFVSIVIESTVVTNYNVDLFCSLNKGPLAVLGRLKFEGLTKTKDNILKKYFFIDDTIINPQLIKSIEKNARSIPFVKFVPPIKQELHQGYLSANLILPFQEKENFLFEGGGGYISEQELFVWNMSLLFQNTFGAGQEISIISQKKDINNQLLKLAYKQPIFLTGQGDADILVQTRDYRDQFYEFVIQSGIKSYYKRKINIGFSGLYKSVELEENNLSYRSAEFSFSISNKILANINDERNFLYDWKFSYGNRKYKNDTTDVLFSNQSFNESRIEINNRFSTKIKSPMTILIDLTIQSYQTDENLPPFAELYLVGGTNSLRGFKDEQFPSIRSLIISAEPQYHFESGNLFLFYDGGYIFNRVSSEFAEFDETTIYRYGYGGGISIFNNSNALKISFGWNKSLNFDNPRISIELKTGL